MSPVHLVIPNQKRKRESGEVQLNFFLSFGPWCRRMLGNGDEDMI